MPEQNLKSSLEFTGGDLVFVQKRQALSGCGAELMTPPKKQKNTSLSRFDIASHAAAINESAEAGVRHILAQRRALDAQGKADTPLVVMAGENHYYPASHLHHFAVLERLGAIETDLLVLKEMPHDLLADTFFGASGIKASPDKAARITEYGEDDAHVAMKIEQAALFSDYANLSHNFFSDAIMRLSLRSCFNDCAQQNGELDMNDGLTEESHGFVRRLAKKKGYLAALYNIQAASHTGMFVRNYHMARMGAGQAGIYKPRIVFQVAGNDHLVGEKEAKLPYSQSLSRFYKQEQGLPVVALHMQCEARDFKTVLPDDCALTEDELFRVRNLPTVSAIYDFVEDMPIAEEPADIQSAADEAAYVNGVLSHMGLGMLCRSAEHMHDRIAAYEEELLTTFEDWRARLRTDERAKQTGKAHYKARAGL